MSEQTDFFIKVVAYSLISNTIHLLCHVLLNFNLTGYLRIILALVSFYVIRTNHIIASSCYILSGLLDAFDGHAARMLNQVSQYLKVRFGRVGKTLQTSRLKIY